MNDKKDEFKECIAREFEEIAREEEEFLENDTSLVVPEGTKEAVLARVREQIRAYEMEQTRKETEEREEAINHLSEEDREALELGRKMLKAGIGQKDPEEPSGKKVRRKKSPPQKEAFENVSRTGSSYCLCAGNGDYQYGRSGEDCADGKTECWGKRG